MTVPQKEHQQAIVIVGAMNPAIHHPGWYRAVELITEVELTTALQAGPASSQAFARFRFDGIEIFCLQDRWQIQGPETSGTRLLKLAMETFARLDETPVSAFGVNNDFHIETVLPDVAAKLATMSAEAGFGLGDIGPASSATFVLVHSGPDCTFRTTIAPSPRGPQYLSVLHNTHRNAPTGARKFSLAPLLEATFQIARSHSDRVSAALASIFR
jgi:hypothetical protein